MIEISLVERPPLPLVDRAGIAVAEAVELPGLVIVANREFDHERLAILLAVKFNRYSNSIDIPHGADDAIREPGIARALAPGVAGELNPVAVGEGLRPVFGP